MRTKVTLILILLNVALYGFIFFVAPPWQEKDPALTRRRVLPPEASAAIDRLQIQHGNAPAITLEKVSGAWRLAAPNLWPANENAVSRILTELQTLEHEISYPVSELATSGQSLADLGLEPASTTILFSSGEKSYELKIGAPTAATNRLYILSPATARIHVVPHTLAEALHVDISSLRSNSLFDIPVFEVRSLALQLDDPSSSRVRLSHAKDRWVFETPIQARADRKHVERMLNQLNQLTAVSFPSAVGETATGLETPSLRIIIEGNQRRQSLLLGAATGPSANGQTEYYARTEDRTPLFTVKLDDALLSLLRNAQTSLRDRRLIDFDPARLTSIDLRTPTTPTLTLQKLDLQSAATSWQVIQTDSSVSTTRSSAADPAIITRLLDALSIFEIETFVTDAPSAADLEAFGFNRPERHVTLHTASELISVEFGTAVPGRDGYVYARLTESPFIYQVRTDLLPELSTLPRHYRQRTLRVLPSGTSISGLRISRTKANAVIFEKQAVENWETALAAEPEKTRIAVTQLIAQLRILRARAFVRETFSESLEVNGEALPWAFRIEATLSHTGGEDQQTTTSTLLASERISGSEMYAGSAEFDATFLANQDFLDALFSLTNAPRDPGPPAASESTPAAQP